MKDCATSYEVLIGEDWYPVNPNLPLSEQTCGMRGYRRLDHQGNVLKQSSIIDAPKI